MEERPSIPEDTNEGREILTWSWLSAVSPPTTHCIHPRPAFDLEPLEVVIGPGTMSQQRRAKPTGMARWRADYVCSRHCLGLDGEHSEVTLDSTTNITSALQHPAVQSPHNHCRTQQSESRSSSISRPVTGRRRGIA